ncbi:MAG TPA: S4 domain-containing protein, partial [Lacipirellula sp.]
MSANPSDDWDGDEDVAPPSAASVDLGAAAPGGAQSFSLTVDEAGAGERLDALLAAAAQGVSRARIRRAIDDGLATVDGAHQKASYRVSAGEWIELQVPAAVEAPQPEPIPLDLLYEDDAIAVVNKAPGMVVHPAKGHWAGTLAAALVHRFNQLSGVG